MSLARKVVLVPLLVAALVGGAGMSHAPTEAAGVVPKPAVTQRMAGVPFYWARVPNWDGGWSTCLFSDSGRALYCF